MKRRDVLARGTLVLLLGAGQIARGATIVGKAPGANGIALNAQIELKGADGSALHYRSLAMPNGRASLQMTLAAQGRSTQALLGALSGSGTVDGTAA